MVKNSKYDLDSTLGLASAQPQLISLSNKDGQGALYQLVGYSGKASFGEIVDIFQKGTKFLTDYVLPIRLGDSIPVKLDGPLSLADSNIQVTRVGQNNYRVTDFDKGLALRVSVVRAHA